MIASVKLMKDLKSYSFIYRMALYYAIWKALFFVIWRVDWLFHLYNSFVWWFIHRIIDATYIALQIIGYTELRIEYANRLIAIGNSGGVDIGEPCIGFGVFATFLAMVVSWKGFQKSQLWFIPLGLGILHLLNIIRVTTLCILSYENRALLDFNHDYTFKIIIYTAILLLWFWWLKINDKENLSKSNVSK